jgi:stage V sporulation protein AD
MMKKLGRQTWQFELEPVVLSTGTVAGKVESEGPLGQWFDVRLMQGGMQDTSWERDEQNLMRQAVETALSKAKLSPSDIDVAIGGDLNAQLTGFYFGLRDFNFPEFGVYSACSTMTQSIALAALLVDAGAARTVLAGTSSHNSTAERQFRFPTEYGAQKPETAQRTVTGAGMAVVGAGAGTVIIREATIGEVVDFGIKNPWEYGAAMAPAAFRTIMTHLDATGRHMNDFDCIATGDLGRIGHAILQDLFAQQGQDPGSILTDCGMLIYAPEQPEVFAGGSGAACSSLVTFGYLLEKLRNGTWSRILIAATGALLSTFSSQQKDSIPAISHAVVFERRGG